ncbi:hypothetical protein MJ1HA_1266 [Metallosphaera sedula]|nr:hypothetical protein MJ1HA_1266 [Metallosphaera sedula]
MVRLWRVAKSGCGMNGVKINLGTYFPYNMIICIVAW